MRKIPVGIIGVSGYTGLELFKILLSHPHFEIAYVANSSGEGSLPDLHPKLACIERFSPRVLPILQKADVHEAIKRCELLFLALPHQQSMHFVKAALQHPHIKVVDLSADYRLSQSHYEQFYCSHLDPENLAHAVYGLPEFYAKEIQNARLVANPGCYPTATLLGLLPFLELIESSVFVDAKSGVSGAGKKLSDSTHYPQINENIFAYSPLTHRHQIEIIEKCQAIGKKSLTLHFIPHLTPLTQGMLVSIFATLHTSLDAQAYLKDFYKDAPFVRIRQNPVDVLSTRGSHFCDLYAAMSGRDLYVSSSIDNLLRGASSQAVVNANLMYGFEPSAGIPLLG